MAVTAAHAFLETGSVPELKPQTAGRALPWLPGRVAGLLRESSAGLPEACESDR
jgi:hypothetical protein